MPRRLGAPRADGAGVIPAVKREPTELERLAKRESERVDRLLRQWIVTVRAQKRRIAELEAELEAKG